MNKGTIGIDLDNVITDSVKLFLAETEKKYGVSCKEEDIKQYAIAEQLGITREKFRSVIDDPDILRRVELFPGAKEGINKIFEKFFSVHIVTARPPEFYELTNDWLVSNGIHFDWLTHTNFKYEYAKNKSIKYFIEDRYRTTIELAGYCDQVLLYNAPWNTDRPIPGNVIRVNNWEEIGEVI